MRYGWWCLVLGLGLLAGCGDCTGVGGQIIDDGGYEPPTPRSILLIGCVEDAGELRAGATVWIPDTSLTTVSGTNGSFTLDISDLPPGLTAEVRAGFGSNSGSATFLIPPAGDIQQTVTLPDCIVVSPPPPPPPQTQLLVGKVVAPDGTTPIAGAQVTLQSEILDFPRVVTAGDGTFVFDLTGQVIPSGPIEIDVSKGVFSGSATANILLIPSVDGRRTLEPIQLQPPSIAVVTGVFDRMQDILAKTGLGDVDSSGRLVLGTEEFDIYDGDDGVTLGAESGYPGFEELFFDLDEDGDADIHNYDIVFINCGVEQIVVDGFVTIRNEPSALDPEKLGILYNYVQEGGVLYCTDLAYDFVEQPFPDFIDFFGSGTTVADDPETPGAAERGVGANPGETPVSTEATVLDTLLASFLDAVTCNSGACRNTNGTVHITGFAPAWAVMDQAHQGAPVKFWVEGTVEIIDQSGSIEVPLTASFGLGQGTVHFSSYHTEEDNPSTGFTAQERILQFLVFETILTPQ